MRWSRAKNFRSIALFVMAGWLAVSQSPPPISAPVSDRLTARHALDLSYAASAGLTPQERTYYLNFLIQAAAPMRHEKTKEWVNELFATTAQVSDSWNKLVNEKNALVAFSDMDAVGALDLFKRLDAPPAEKDRLLDEDPRADAARTIFVRYWKSTGLAGIDRLRNLAVLLGNTGQYPFAAMTSVIREIDSSDEALAQSIFLEAVGAFRNGGRVQSESEEFVQFLLDIHPFMPPWLLKPALEMCADRLLKSSVRKDETYVAVVSNPKASTAFTSQSQLLLARLMSVAEEVDSDLASKLRDRQPPQPDRSVAFTENPNISEVVVRGSADPSKLALLQQRGLEQQRLATIRSISTDDPNEALRLGETLTDPALQSSAWAVMARAQAQPDPVRARELLNRSRTVLKNVKDEASQLSALADMAEAASSSGDVNALREITDRGFRVGVETFESDLDAYPDKPAYDVKGFDPLRLLTRLSVKSDFYGAVARIMALDNAELKAYLLVWAAEELFEVEKTPPRTATPLPVQSQEP
jgi:hypothetical protein